MMTLEETLDKDRCDECGAYEYVWELRVKDFDDDAFYEELKKRIAVSKPRENATDASPQNLASTY